MSLAHESLAYINGIGTAVPDHSVSKATASALMPTLIFDRFQFPFNQLAPYDVAEVELPEFSEPF